MSDKKFVNKYLEDFSSIVKPNEKIVEKIIATKDVLLQLRDSGGKLMIFGNGGSAAIASHVSVDLTKNALIRSVNFNEADLITCFSNDYGYEKWVEKAVEFYSDKNDVLVLISSSGKSQNMINAIKSAKKRKFKKIISFTGFNKNNPLNKNSDIFFWINSKSYNIIENSHQFYLLMIVDLVKKLSK